MRIGAFILLLWAAAAGSREAKPAAAADTIASCIRQADDADVGIDALEAACPGLTHALDESGYGALLNETERQYLTRSSLEDLQQVARRYSRPPGAGDAASDVTKLAPILRDLDRQVQEDRPLTWLERLQRWLEGLLDRGQHNRDSWLSRWLREVDVPQRVANILVYSAIALILVVALAIVVNEVRARRLGGRRSRGRRESPYAPTARNDPTFADVEAAPLHERPGLLLRVLVHSLLATGRLHADKSLTHNELGRRARFDAGEQRASFDRVAVLSERLLYGNGSVAADEIDAVMQAGRSLNEQLNLQRAPA